MKEIYSTLLYNQKQLIVKTVPGQKPYVIAECYSEDIAGEICELLNKEIEDSGEKSAG